MVLQELIESTEFVLKKSKVRDLRSLFENRVRHLFGVELEVLPCEHDVINEENVENPPHQWIRVVCTEHPEQLERAKEYIISVCNPEVRSRVDFQICDLLDERTSLNIVDEVEEKTCAYLAVDSEGFLEICGSKMAVALASSSLQQMKFLSSPSDGKDSVESQEDREEYKQIEKETTENFEAEVVWYKRSDTPKVVKPSKSANASSAKECSSENLPVEEKDSESTTNSTGVSEKPGLDSKSNQELNGNDIPLSSADSITESEAGESLRDFAIKLRYSEAEVSTALFKLGPEADKNKLLMELVKAQASAKQIEEGSSMERPSYVQSPPVGDPGTFRSIVIDGSNVAMSHGNQKVFSCRGIGIAVDWFINRGHRDIKVFVPSWRKESTKPESPIIDQEVMTRLDEDNILIWTPSRRINGRRVVCYDDRFIIRLAHQTDGVIVSNDNFRDLQNESLEWKKVIEQRLLMYSFADDRFMPPDDPAGRHGPTLDEFLHKGCGKACPYGRRCTYGNRCKYLHPERNSKTESEMGELARQLSEKKLFLTPPEIPYSEVIKDNTGSFRESSRQGRPLPPLPDMPAYLLTKPLPPTPKELPQRQAKPLPIPQAEIHHNMTRMFPPTLRMNHSSQGQRPASDPLPQRPPYYEGNGMQEQYTRSLTRRGSMPHIMPGGPSYIEGYPSLPGGSGHFSHPMYPTHHNMAHPTDIQRGMVVPSVDSRPVMHDDGYGACGYQQPYQQVQPGYPPQHWGAATPFQQPQYQLGPPYHISLSGHPHFQHQYLNNYGGQGNSYFRTRAPPTDTDVTDGVSEGTDVSERAGECAEEGRIKAYETLLEVFPEDAAKILKLLDENPEVSDVEKLTQLLLDEE